MSTRTLSRATDLFDDDNDERGFDAFDFVRVPDLLLDRVNAMHLQFGMGLREATAHGYLPSGTIEDVIAVEWGRHRPNAHHDR